MPNLVLVPQSEVLCVLAAPLQGTPHMAVGKEPIISLSICLLALL